MIELLVAFLRARIGLVLLTSETLMREKDRENGGIIPKPKEILRALIVSLIITMITLAASGGNIFLAITILIIILVLFAVLPPIIKILANVAEKMRRKDVYKIISGDQLDNAVLLIAKKVFLEKRIFTYEELQKELDITPMVGKILLEQLESKGIIYAPEVKHWWKKIRERPAK